MSILKPFSRLLVQLFAGLIMVTFFIASPVLFAAIPPASTTTQLGIASGGTPVTLGGSVASGGVVTLTATVNAGATAVTVGQVNFCDATAAHCTDIHLLGMAQLTSAGTAVLKLRPGIGSHSYKAVFLGTNAYAGSSSIEEALTATGIIPSLATATTIAETGSWGNYSLSATVTEVGGTAAPTGTVSFLDTNNGNAVTGEGVLGAAIPGISWLSALTPITGFAPSIVAAGDFNGDGIPDLIVANKYVQSLTILLGNGDGTYTAMASGLPIVFNPIDIAVGDFNGDGIQDLAVVDSSNSIVGVFLGHGDGTFTLASMNETGSSPHRIAIADFNGDGFPDLAVTNQENGSGSVTVLLGNGDGTFTAASVNPAVGGNPYGIVSGDFNGDGKTDLAVTTLYNGNLTILLGNGDGTFIAAASPAVTSYCYNIASADFNGDGVQDLVVSCSNFGIVKILLGNGDGTFTAAPAFPTDGIYPGAIVVADFNEDGIADLAMMDGSSSGGIKVFLGHGDGAFAQSLAIPPAISGSTSFLVTGDFNGDGRTDLAIASNSNNGILVYLTEPTETATAIANTSMSGVGEHLVDASYGGDGNYNSSITGATSLWGVPPSTATTLTVSSGGAPVTSVHPGSVVALTAMVKAGANPVTTGQVSFCDASATDCTDIHLLGTVALNSGGTAVYKFVPGAGTHSYKAVFMLDGFGLSSSSSASTLTVSPAKSIVYTDTTTIAESGFSGAYSLTATVVGFGGSAPVTGNVSFLDTSYGNTSLATVPLGSSTAGIGWLISQTQALTASPKSEVTGDFNGDGIPDIALLWTNSSSTGEVTILFGKGDGTFTTGPTTQAAVAGQSYSHMIVGDFNGDGKTDLVLLGWQASNYTSYVTTLLGNGDVRWPR